jgi:hypothetical protein
MSAECEKCGEHALECNCGIGCNTPGSKIKKYSLKPVESISIPEWISVHEKLPEPYDFVLVFATTQGTNEPNPISLARLLPGRANWEFLSEYEDGSGAGVYQDLEWPVEVEDITHWMKLPKRPLR